MAGTQEAVTSLLMQVWRPATARAAAEERAALEALALSRGEPATIEPWDWRFYAEKVRQVRYALDEAEVKPYFPLERITEAAFDCAGRLFGLSFVARPDIAVYHPDVEVYEVRGADGARGRPVPARQLRPADQAQRRLDELVPCAVEDRRQQGRRAGAADHRQQQQLRQGRAGRSRRCSASTTRARCSTSSATACTGCSRTSPTSGCRAPTCCATSSSCRRSCSSTGSRSPRC